MYRDPTAAALCFKYPSTAWTRAVAILDEDSEVWENSAKMAEILVSMFPTIKEAYGSHLAYGNICSTFTRTLTPGEKQNAKTNSADAKPNDPARSTDAPKASSVDPEKKPEDNSLAASEEAVDSEEVALMDLLKSRPLLKFFVGHSSNDESHYEYTRDEFGDFETIKTKERLANTSSPIVANYAGDQLKYTYVLGWQQKGRLGEWMSYVEPIFDDLFALRSNSMHCTIREIREGGGMPILYVTRDVLNNPKKLKAAIAQFRIHGSADSIVVLVDETRPDGTGSKIGVEYSSTTGFDFSANEMRALRRISTYTSIPKIFIEGAPQGEQAGAEANERLMSDYWEIHRQHADPWLKWIAEHVADFMGWTLPENWSFDFEDREEPNPKSEAEVLKLQVDAAATMFELAPKAGWNNKQILQKCGIDIDVKEIDLIALAEENKAAMLNNTDGQTEDNERDTDGPRPGSETPDRGGASNEDNGAKG